MDPATLGLPSERDAMIRYLTNSYKGVGQKTAEALVDGFGAELYQVMSQDPARIAQSVTPRRAEQLLKGWKADLARRKGKQGGGEGSSEPSGEVLAENAPAAPASRRRTRRGGRGRGREDRKPGEGNESGAQGGS